MHSFLRCSVSDAIYTRKLKFVTKLQSTEIGLCTLFVKKTVDELATVHECIGLRVMTTCISSQVSYFVLFFIICLPCLVNKDDYNNNLDL